MNLYRPHAMGFWLFLIMTSAAWCLPPVYAVQTPTETGEELHIEVTKKGASKQVVMSQGTKEWFMLIDVTPENAVILKQEKEHDRYLVDESETHDRPMTADEVDAAITAYVNSVKARLQKK